MALSPTGTLATSDFLTQLHELAARLNATDLRPCPEVNEAFGRLVELCTVIDDHLTGQVLRDPATAGLIDSLRAVSSRGESELERAWARRVIGADDPWAELRRFPYLCNYQRLVRFELAGLLAVGAETPRSTVVLGAGPLPLTGLVLARDHGVRVTNVDHDAEACELGSDLVRALGLAAEVDTVCDDARGAADLPAVALSDTVLLAALAGNDGAAKRDITRPLAKAMHLDAHLLTRSAHRLRTALYPAVSPDDLEGFTTLVEMHPCDDVVNSVLIARPAVGG
ncbi:nicotianamine synthase family protein [Nocardiopsis oceani]